MSHTVAPLVSVGMPVHNGARYLQEAIDSILSQDLEDLELVISDNGSTDETQAIGRAAVQKDHRVRYLREEENRGAAWNYNRVLHLSRGIFFHWAACDDTFGPTYLTRCVEALRTDPGLVLAFTTTRVVDSGGTAAVKPTWRPPPGYATQGRPADRFHDVLWHATMCFEVFGVTRREVLLDTAGIRAFSSSDRALLTDLALRGRFEHIDEPLFINRVHGEDSMHAYSDTLERARWFDPGSSMRFPRWRLLGAYTETAWRASPSSRDQLAALAHMGHWMLRQRRALFYDLLRVMPYPVPQLASRARDHRLTRRNGHI